MGAAILLVLALLGALGGHRAWKRMAGRRISAAKAAVRDFEFDLAEARKAVSASGSDQVRDLVRQAERCREALLHEWKWSIRGSFFALKAAEDGSYWADLARSVAFLDASLELQVGQPSSAQLAAKGELPGREKAETLSNTPGTDLDQDTCLTSESAAQDLNCPLDKVRDQDLAIREPGGVSDERTVERKPTAVATNTAHPAVLGPKCYSAPSRQAEASSDGVPRKIKLILTTEGAMRELFHGTLDNRDLSQVLFCLPKLPAPTAPAGYKQANAYLQLRHFMRRAECVRPRQLVLWQRDAATTLQALNALLTSHGCKPIKPVCDSRMQLDSFCAFVRKESSELEVVF